MRAPAGIGCSSAASPSTISGASAEGGSNSRVAGRMSSGLGSSFAGAAEASTAN